MAKRAFDVAVAGTALVVGAPLLALVSAAIRLDSPGPILFRQIRVGRDKRPIETLKLRTMVADADRGRVDVGMDQHADRFFGDGRHRSGTMRQTGRERQPRCVDHVVEVGEAGQVFGAETKRLCR